MRPSAANTVRREDRDAFFMEQKNRMMSKTRVCFGLFAVCLQAIVLAMLPASLRADIRIATWNISDYDGTNVTTADIRNVLFGTYQGRAMNPDVIIVQEFKSQAAVNAFLTALNTDPNNPNEWKAAPFITGPDTQSEFFYRDAKFIFLAGTTIAAGSSSSSNTTQPRNTNRYDVQLKGFPNNPPVLACYAVHMKAGSDPVTDQPRRLVEATRIRANAQTLPVSWSFLMAGDTNIQSASQDAYQKLVDSEANNAGRFFDPIHPLGTTPTTWNNNSTYRFIHTQDPSGNPANYGGMDDRFDMILLSLNLNGGTGLRYKGNPAIKFSQTTWNDPNHSTRAWGNDGTSYNQKLTTTLNGVENAMVGASIAQSIINAGGLTGHIPVFLDLVTPTATANVSGHISLESVANPAKLLTFLFTPSSGTAFSHSVTPASDGSYSITGIPTGVYTVGIKGDKWLRRNQMIDATSANVTNLDVTLLGGDANNDNAVDITDLTQVISAYNTTLGNAGYLDAADFTCDGSVDIADLLLLIGNYNKVGD